MAAHNLTENFSSFFKNINPSSGTEAVASRDYNTIKSLIESPIGPASELSPRCFLQGSYRQQTAIHTLHDVDIVALCALWQPGSGSAGIKSWPRNDIFNVIAAAIAVDAKYKSRLRFTASSMCIKVDLDLKIEVLPVVYKAGNNDYAKEPFRLFRPETNTWTDGFARNHQQLLTLKNDLTKTGGNFIPAIKTLKHLRALHSVDSVSFHIECLLSAIPDEIFIGQPVDYIPAVLNYISSFSAPAWFNSGIKTPCGDRMLFTPSEWSVEKWTIFHNFIANCGTVANQAVAAPSANAAKEKWRILLGEDYFPML